jgi:hypothetical protein
MDSDVGIAAGDRHGFNQALLLPGFLLPGFLLPGAISWADGPIANSIPGYGFSLYNLFVGPEIRFLALIFHADPTLRLALTPMAPTLGAPYAICISHRFSTDLFP